MILPDDYLRAVADAVHAVGGLLVLDCIASGAMWVDMQATGVDVLVSAPQKGWSSSPCCAMVMLSERARTAIDSTTSTSFACDLKKWLAIMETYESGAHAYHATMPTDALTRLWEVMLETERYGFDRVRQEQIALGAKVRALFESRGIKSVAADGFKAPGVVVSYTDDPGLQSSKKFLAEGLQTAAGAMRRRQRFFNVPHRPVRARKMAQRRSHRVAFGRSAGSAGYRPAINARGVGCVAVQPRVRDGSFAAATTARRSLQRDFYRSRLC
jgi:aspartate aminotransferase-like enzyme